MSKKEEFKVLNLDKEHYTVMANDIVRGKQAMTLQQARLLRLMITQVVKQDKDFKTYKTTVPELAEFLNLSESNMYRDIRNLCKSLIRSTVEIGTDNPKEPWKIFQWVQLAQYDGEELTLMLSNQIAPYVLELNKSYTQYQLKNILSMKSFYAIRMYELLKCDIGDTKKKRYDEKTDTMKYTVKELREYFGCENKLKQFGQFKETVIETALLEINQNQESDLYVLYEYNSKKKPIKEVIFHFLPCADTARNGLIDWGIVWQSDFEKPVQTEL